MVVPSEERPVYHLMLKLIFVLVMKPHHEVIVCISKGAILHSSAVHASVYPRGSNV